MADNGFFHRHDCRSARLFARVGKIQSKIDALNNEREELEQGIIARLENGGSIESGRYTAAIVSEGTSRYLLIIETVE